MRKVSVLFTVPGKPVQRMNCQLVEGYSTEADLPKIIAVALWSDNKLAYMVTVVEVTDVA